MKKSIIGKLYKWNLDYGTIYLDDEGQKRAIFSGDQYVFDLEKNDVFLILSNEYNNYGRKNYRVLFKDRKCKLIFEYSGQLENCAEELKYDI